MSKSHDTYIKYRIKRAEESFDDAQIMIEKHSWNSAVNRLYYACFYAVIALLLKKGLDVRSHEGARIKFSDEFVKTVTVFAGFLLSIKFIMLRCTRIRSSAIY